jgi:hypothetical protein
MSPDETPDRLDDRVVSSRQLAFWYVAAFVSYVVVSMFEKGLLNWIIGPIWLVVFVSFGPVLVDRFRRAR